MTKDSVPGNYNSPISVELVEEASVTISYRNDGHGITATVDFENNLTPNITGGPLGDDKYTFFNFHLHWPSEHTIDGVYYPAELHIVHFNLKYGTIANAVTKSDGLAVVGVFCEVSGKFLKSET